jgi:hypothetical protein
LADSCISSSFRNLATVSAEAKSASCRKTLVQPSSRIARLFRLAKASVDRELAAPSDASNRAPADAPHRRRATSNQIRAIRAIAQRLELDLDKEVKTRFGVCRPDDLSLEQASQLIDALKPSTNGAINHPGPAEESICR